MVFLKQLLLVREITMKTIVLKVMKFWLSVTIGMALLAETAFTCTSFQIVAGDGSVIIGRSHYGMNLKSIDLKKLASEKSRKTKLVPTSGDFLASDMSHKLSEPN